MKINKLLRFSQALLLFISLVRSDPRPNIVFILADDLGFNDVGYHARSYQSGVKTPFLDRLADEGVKLENYYVQPVCTPTRAQLLSGRHAINTGLQHGVVWPDLAWKALPLDYKILPQQLRSCGYDTHMVGKWHLGHYKSKFLPHRRGFNSYFGFLGDSEDYFTHERYFRSMRGVDMYSSVEEGPVNDTWGEYSAHLFARKSIEAIQNRDNSKPFFLYLSYQSVHIPVQVPSQYSDFLRHIKNKRRRRYAGMVLAMDESIQNVTEHLKHSGLLNNTIIVFSTDNGGANNGGGGNNWPLRGGKNTVWEGGVRAVGFVHGKPLGIQGLTHKGLVDVSDWFPTFLRVAECPILNGTQALDGVDQWDAIRQEAATPREEVLHHIDKPRSKVAEVVRHGFNVKRIAAIRVGRWKLITGNPKKGSWCKPPEAGSKCDLSALPHTLLLNGTIQDLQLYDIDNDPYESVNVAALQPGIVEDLLKRLARYDVAAPKPVLGKHDRKANPKFYDGFWVPWLDDDR